MSCVYAVRLWGFSFTSLLKRVGITPQPNRPLEIAKNKLIKMNHMLWNDSLRKGTISGHLCLVMAMTAHLEMISSLYIAGGEHSILPGSVCSVCAAVEGKAWEDIAVQLRKDWGQKVVGQSTVFRIYWHWVSWAGLREGTLTTCNSLNIEEPGHIFEVLMWETGNSL